MMWVGWLPWFTPLWHLAAPAQSPSALAGATGTPLWDARALAEGTVTAVAVVSWYSFRKLQAMAEHLSRLDEAIGGAGGIQKAFERFEERMSRRLDDISSIVTAQRVEIENVEAGARDTRDELGRQEEKCVARHEFLRKRLHDVANAEAARRLTTEDQAP